MSIAKQILEAMESPRVDVDAIRARNPNRKVHDVGSTVQMKPTSLGQLHKGETGKVVNVEDHGAGMIAHYVMWPRKRKPEMHWGGNLEVVS